MANIFQDGRERKTIKYKANKNDITRLNGCIIRGDTGNGSIVHI